MDQEQNVFLGLWVSARLSCLPNTHLRVTENDPEDVWHSICARQILGGGVLKFDTSSSAYGIYTTEVQFDRSASLSYSIICPGKWAGHT